ncbi:hypothetical protein FDECE_8071 [Fusarium decemcellulare]|nr:hypothetical protein FDECE_8071 [Fusarium decemcellulare]
MPQTEPLITEKLGIRLDYDGRREYAPGDTITGQVFRQSPAVSPDSWVRISICGRSKSKITKRRRVPNENRTVVEGPYRGRFDLVYSPDTAQKIFEGPLHIKEGDDELAWPFAIILPLYSDSRCVADHNDRESYLTLYGTQHPLPPTIETSADGYWAEMEGFVEYWLEAELNMTKHGKIKQVEARLPFKLTTPNQRSLIQNFEPKASTNNREIASFHLAPGMEHAKLSFKQKMKQTFSSFSSTVPKLDFEVEVTAPTIIQLDNPSPIPFQIRVLPNWESTSEILRDVPLKIKLKTVDLNISSVTRVTAGWTGEVRAAKTTYLYVSNAIEKLGDDIYLGFGEGLEPLDLGKLINLRIGREGRIGSDEGHHGSSLVPNFCTYNIGHLHELKWNLEIEIAGESIYVENEQEIAILASRGGQE